MRQHLTRSLLAASLLGFPVVSGCAALAVGAVGVIVSQEFVDNAQVAYLQEDSDVVWAVSKSALSHMSLHPIEVDNDLKAARAKIENEYDIRKRVAELEKIYDRIYENHARH